MKVISLWQPWASLMAYGLKKNETRSWATEYRGPLAIHAAQKESIDQYAAWMTFKSNGLLKSLEMDGIYEFTDLPRGGIIATLNLIDCIKIREDNLPEYPELSFGDYRIGRYMWITENVQRFKKIIPMRGYQRIFEVPDEFLKVCRVCGCSEYNACEGGCSWIDKNLCSACAGSTPAQAGH